MMAGGWAKDGSVQEQIDASTDEAVKRIRQQLPQGESLFFCEGCNREIPEARRKAMQGVHFCVACQSDMEQDKKRPGTYNRRGSKDSQLR